MFKTYLPRRFCRDLVAIRGHSAQLSMLMSVILGVKPCMDDWVQFKQYAAYKAACKKYGLILKESSVFQVVDKRLIPGGVVGKSRLTTTSAYGYQYLPSCRISGSSVHVFISRSREKLEECMRNGWYPVIIKNRVIDKPLADVYRFGYALGYPACCIEYFRRFNNWSKYSYVYEALKNSSGERPVDYLCNPFSKDDTYTYIYHMPCSYNCQATKEKAGELRKAIIAEEPEFAAAIDCHLQLPYLVIYERRFFAFEGFLKRGVIHYRKVYSLGQSPLSARYFDLLLKGDAVWVEGKDIFISKKGKNLAVIKTERKDFAPEYPFVIQFAS